MNTGILDQVHRYWFGEPAKPVPAAELIERWFRPTAEIDAYIHTAYAPHLDAARAFTWDLPRLTREQQVALVVLLDQFPRQVFRERPEAFAYDAKALEVAERLTRDGGWRRFLPLERTFVLLPFEHSESVADQDFAVMLFAEAVQAAPAEAVEGARAALDFATKHRDIIRRFGRFPHRNSVLGRASTPEEIEFLKSGRGF
jgi:uncharacterized protein (DUF924 family)